MSTALRLCLRTLASVCGVSFLLLSLTLSVVALPVLLCALFWLE
ncbi:MAG: hypothetical protein AB1505_24410 [Candidatus Latescibacterota bacterium]